MLKLDKKNQNVDYAEPVVRLDEPPMPHGWLGIVCHSAACRGCIKVRSMAAFGKHRPEPQVPGAGAAWPLSLHSGPLKGVKSL